MVNKVCMHQHHRHRFIFLALLGRSEVGGRRSVDDWLARTQTGIWNCLELSGKWSEDSVADSGNFFGALQYVP
jgi:hypothetical protein